MGLSDERADACCSAAAKRRAADHLEVAELARRLARRNDRAAEPEPFGLAQPPLEAGHRPELAEQSDLAAGERLRSSRPVAER